MKKIILFVSLFMTQYGTSYCQCTIDYNKIANVCNPVIEDDFSTFSTTNAFQWKTSNLPSTGGIDNCPWYEKNSSLNNKNYYKISADQVTVSGGQLHLKVAKLSTPESFAGICEGEAGPHIAQYKSGMIESDRKFRYGVFEFKCKMPISTPNSWDTWPTLWLYGGNTEIDMFDGGGTDPGRKALMSVIDWSKQKPSAVLVNPIVTWDWTVLPANTSLTNLPVYSTSSLYLQNDIVKYYDPAFNWRAYKASRNLTRQFMSSRGNNLNANLSSSFHTYTVAWLPNKVIFFFDGREICTMDNTQVQTDYSPTSTDSWNSGLRILCNLQLWKGIIDANYSNTELNNISMDIDYIKVWELNDANLLNNNISISEETSMMYHEIEKIPHDSNTLHEELVSSNIDARYGSIAVNPNNTNEIFFRKKHSNNKFRIFRKDLSTTDLPVLIAYGYNIDETAAEAVGELKFKDGILYYVGGDKRIQYFARANPVTSPDTWWHGWVDDNWNNSTYWSNAAFRVDINGSGIFDVADNRDVYYKSETGLLCVLKFTNSTDWYGEAIDITPKSGTVSNLVHGDICITANGSNHRVAYKTNVSSTIKNKIYVSSRPISSTSRSSFITFTINSPSVSTKAGSILNKTNETFFINSDNFIHRTGLNSANASTKIFECSSTSGNCAAEKVNSNLQSEGSSIHYVGADGKLQYIFPSDPAQPMGLSNTGHWWMDTHWNTNYFQTFIDPVNNLGVDVASASYIVQGGKLFYARKHNQTLIGGSPVARIGYFIYENCHVTNPTEEPINFSKTYNQPSYSIKYNRHKLEYNVRVYPNPIDSDLNIDFDGDDATVTIYSLEGNMIASWKISNGSNKLDVLFINKGMYIVKILDEEGNAVAIKKIIKN